MKQLLIVFKIFMFLAFAKAYSQQTPSEKNSFSLQQAIEYGLENNYQAINAKRDIAKALKQKWETTATGLPQINGDVQYTYNLKTPILVFNTAPFNPDSNEPNFQAFPAAPLQSMNLTATLTQLIFDGSYIVALEASKTFLEFSENANNKTKLEIRKGIINAYGGVLLTQENINILSNNLETVEDNLNETTKIFENGLAEEEDVEQLKITRAQIANQLNTALRQEEIARDMLKLALGIELETNIVLTDNLEGLSVSNLNMGIINEPLNIESNVDYRIANNFSEQRRLEYKLERSKALPSLGAFVNYGTQAFDDESFVFFNRNTPWFQQSVAGLSLSVPIFSSFGRKAAQDRTKIAWEQAQTELDQTIQQINLDYEAAINNYKSAIDNYTTSKENLALAQRIENKNTIKFKEGLSTSFDLRQAQLQLYSVQAEYLNSMYSVITEKANLETIMNTPDFINEQ